MLKIQVAVYDYPNPVRVSIYQSSLKRITKIGQPNQLSDWVEDVDANLPE
jgi:hypothetical protein